MPKDAEVIQYTSFAIKTYRLAVNQIRKMKDRFVNLYWLLWNSDGVFISRIKNKTYS